MKPRITRGPAANYETPNEIIREFTSGETNGAGGLISIRTQENGDDTLLIVDLYRLDPTVRVLVPKANLGVPR